MPGSLPDRPDRAMRTVWLVRMLLLTPIVTIGAVPLWGSALIAADAGRGSWLAFWLTLVAVPVLWVVWCLAYLPHYCDRYRFRLEGDTVVVERGVFWRRTVRIPLERVQNVVVQKGPLLSAFRLTTLHLHDAPRAARAGEGQLPGLTNGSEVAARLMERIEDLRTGRP